MNKNKISKIIIIFIFIFLFLFLFIALLNSKFFEKKEVREPQSQELDNELYSSNKIQDVKYTTKDADGNEYIIRALQGEIDYTNPNILYLTNVNALIKLKNSNIVTITSKFGRYNSENFDTIFSKNVVINYLDNEITSDYLDLSMQRNSMIISKDVTFTNLENILKADVVEMNISTKDIKIFMHKKNDRIEIKSK